MVFTIFISHPCKSTCQNTFLREKMIYTIMYVWEITIRPHFIFARSKNHDFSMYILYLITFPVQGTSLCYVVNIFQVMIQHWIYICTIMNLMNVSWISNFQWKYHSFFFVRNNRYHLSMKMNTEWLVSPCSLKMEQD